jgi:hypothetical protein
VIVKAGRSAWVAPHERTLPLIIVSRRLLSPNGVASAANELAAYTDAAHSGFRY